MTSKLQDLISRIEKYNLERNWAQFHNPKDLAITLSLEASELLEHFQWKNTEEMQLHLTNNKSAVSDELADVFYNVLLMCHYFDIDIIAASNSKMDKNEAKYPIDKAKNSHAKYSEFD
jgi:NTP pyrophosphatase (non-canonical NTP hydrolase)